MDPGTLALYVGIGLFSILNFVVVLYCCAKFAERQGWYFGMPLLLLGYLAATFLLANYWSTGVVVFTASIWLAAAWFYIDGRRST